MAENGISRDREFAADQVGVQVTDPQAMGSALVKVHAFSGCWDGGIKRLMVNALAEGKQYTNLSAVFAAVVQDVAKPSALEGLDAHRLPHPTDSHPPLSQRLEALGLTVQDLANPALQTSPEIPPITLIPGYEDTEKELTGFEHALLVQSGIPVGSAEPQPESKARGD